MPQRLIITLALLFSALLLVALPRLAAAASATATTSAPVPAGVPAAGAGATIIPAAHAGLTTIPASGAATQGTRDVCSLSGLVPARGSSCAAGGRLRPQLFGVPFVPNPVHVVKKVVGGAASTALTKILGWVASGAESALKETAKVIDDTTSPQLTSGWFSASYWRVAGIAALLTVPFLCAAAIHAIVRSDLGLLTRAAFGYLPLSLLAVGIASQLTMLLLAGTDEMSSIVASASLHADGVFLSTTSVKAVAESVATGDPFVTFLAAIITVAATLALWLELLVRDAAVYVIVLMLPMFFAAMVWPARRTLAIRAIETLIALILSKFAIVAVLSLGGSALGHSTIPGAASVLTGATLVLLAAFTPWALLRMLPLHEVASAAAGGLSQAPKEPLASAAGRALQFADGAGALGAAAFGRGAMRGGEPALLEGAANVQQRSAADAGAEPGAAPSWAEPVDADVAEPVTDAMAGTPGSDPIGSESPTLLRSVPENDAPGSAPAVGATGDGGSVSPTSQPTQETGSVRRPPEVRALVDALGGGDSEFRLGDDMLGIAEQRQLPPAGAGVGSDDPTVSPMEGPASAALDPPMPPTRAAIGPRPADDWHRGADVPPALNGPAPEPELDPFGEDA